MQTWREYRYVEMLTPCPSISLGKLYKSQPLNSLSLHSLLAKEKMERGGGGGGGWGKVVERQGKGEGEGKKGGGGEGGG